MEKYNKIVFYEDINNPGIARVIEEEVRYWHELNKDTMTIKHTMFGEIRNDESASESQKILIIYYEGEAGLNPFTCPHSHYRLEVVDPQSCGKSGISNRWCTDCKIYLDQIQTEALEHEYEYISNIDATCLNDGTLTKKCIHCGEYTILPDPDTALGHDYQKTYNNDATCIADGTNTHKCSRCGDSYNTTEFNTALGHSFKYSFNNDATCLEDGTETGTCTRCNHKIIRTYPNSALGHEYPYKWTVRNESTCLGQGLRFKKCIRCDNEITEPIDPLGHNYKRTVSSQETCLEDRIEVDTCSRCGDKIYYTIANTALDHKIETIYDKNATCLKNGTNTHTCVRCGYTYKTEAEGTALGHDYPKDWTTRVESTCTETGIKFKKCTRCSHEITDVIPELGHDHQVLYDNNATCTEDGTNTHTCTRCGNSYKTILYGSSLGHLYPDDWTTKTAATCTTDGLKFKKCVRCDHEITEVISKLNHDYVKKYNNDATCIADGTNTHKCSRCGDSYNTTAIDSKLGHDFSSEYTIDKAATCTTNGSKSQHCSRCDVIQNETIIPANGHSYGSITYTWNGYTSCTAKRTCSVCGHVETVNATITSRVTTEATCTTNGIRTYTASFSNSAYESQSKTETINAYGHNYENYVTTTEPTCVLSGIKKRTCKTCGHVDSAVVAALGHNFSSLYTIDKVATCTTNGSKSQHCSRCDVRQNITTIPATGHDYGNPVYTWSGYTGCTGKRTCKTCGHIETVTATITNVITTSPTCTGTGIRTYTAKFSNSAYTTQTKTETLAANGHSYPTNWTTRTAATCTATGLQYKKCTVCGNEITQSIAALGHAWVSNNNGTHKCSRCNTTGTCSPNSPGSTCSSCGYMTPNITLAVTTSSVSNMVIDTSFSQTLTSNATSSGVTWSLYSGSLPPGISLSSAGVLSGKPTSSGVYTFTVKCTWSGQTATKQFSVNIANRMVTVTFNANGGTCSESSRKIAEGSMIGTLPTATRSGYEFGGWFTAATGGLKVDSSYSVASNTTLYARWGQGTDLEFGDATTQFNIQVNGDRTNYANNPYTFYHRYSDGSTSSLTIQTAISSTDGTNNMTSTNKTVTLYMKVTNNGAAGNFDIGFDADSYVVGDGNDQVKIKRLSNGFQFGSNSNSAYTLTVPYTTIGWCGRYSSRTSNRYNEIGTGYTTGSIDTGFALTMTNIFINSSSYTILEVTFKMI